MKKRLVVLILIIFSCIFTLSARAETENDGEMKIAKVLEVSQTNGLLHKEQIAKVKILDENFTEADSEFFITNIVPNNLAYAINAEPGRKYLIHIDQESDEIYIADYYREPVVMGVIVFFLLLVILFGRSKGIKAILSLTLTGVAVIYFLIPGIKEGQDPILLAILVSAFATAVTMLLIAGFTRKSLAATIGTTGGVTVAGLIANYVIHSAPLSGLATTEAHILLGNMTESSLNFQGILGAGIIISSLGAAMDVAISIASATQEIFETNHRQGRRELFAHAINIGKDIMGTMTNTLILAYAGASIPLFLLLHSETGLRLLNMEIIATELCAAVIGSTGLLLAIPITAISAVLLLKPLR
jgi:uncharacterized membrane protein